MPRSVPPVVGPQILTKYHTAKDLHAYLKARMPWYAPGTLTDEEYWQLTAYLARANGLFDDTTVLTSDTAAAVRFAPEPQPTQSGLGPEQPPAEPEPAATSAVPWQIAGLALLVAALVALLAVGLLRWRG